MYKAELRDRFIELRSDLSPAEVQSWTKQIISTLKTAIDWSLVSKVHSYKSVPSWKEVDTTTLKAVLSAINPGIELEYGNPDRSTLRPEDRYDVIIVPLLTFDKSLNRIGFGGGWYDRFLATQSDAKKIGLAYDFQLTDDITVKAHDIPLDLVVTQTQVFTKQKS